MNLRIARHTSDLNAIILFYHNILGLEILGSFKNHGDYDGVFLGIKNENWHLEFTVSSEKPDHKADANDLLVFYPESQEKFLELIDKIRKAEIKVAKPKNPYWEENGITYLDPDGYRIVIAKLAK